MEPDPDEHVHPGQEDLVWGSGIKDKERRKGNAPSAKYNKFSEQARRLIAGESQCAMFCGGKKCKYCTTDNWKPEQTAIKGLYSEWVTDNILAMARPSNHSIDKYNILEQFLENGIKTVINLQQPGEHASCGYGNDNSGFSYNPQRLMDKDIFFYNFAWQDYGIAPMSTLLDIVKVMQFGVAMGKVAVHCHAGLGRTGLLIACYLVYNNRVKAGEAVHYVRSRRAGAIQTSQQVQTVLDFETHLRPFRTIFPSKVAAECEVSFKHFLNRQSHLLHGFEARRLKHIPKVVYVCCERLLQLAGQGQSLSKVATESASPSSPIQSHLPSQSSSMEFVVQSSFSQLSVHSADNLSSLLVLGKARTSISLEDLSNSRFKKLLTEGKDDDDDSSCGEGHTPQDVFMNDTTNREGSKDVSMNIANNVKEGNETEEDDDDCIVFGKPDIVITKDQNVRDNHLAGRETPTVVLNDVQSDPSSTTPPSDKLVSTPSSGPTLVKVWSLDNDSDNTSAKDSSTNHEANPTKKRKGKRKGLGERFKNRRKKTDAQSSSTDAKQDDKEGVDSDEKSSRSGSGALGSSTTSDNGAKEPVHMLPSSNEFGVEGSSSVVCRAMVASEYRSDIRKKADDIEVQLNETDQAWLLLADEEDPSVLSAVYWDWLNQLKEPVLRKQDLVYLLERTETPKESLRHLEKSVKHFIEHQATVLSKLFPQSEDLETRLVECLLSHLTHQSVTLNLTFTATPNQPSHWGEMRSSDASRLVEFFFKLIDEVAAPRERL